jgi:hypothetical protein
MEERLIAKTSPRGNGNLTLRSKPKVGVYWQELFQISFGAPVS